MTSSNSLPADQPPDGGDLTFEDAFRRLSEIAERLEAGGLTLADATAGYEQGMQLVRHCNELLDSAELEITTLRENNQRGTPAPFHAPLDEPPDFDGTFVEEEEELDF